MTNQITPNQNYYAIIPAAGVGARMSSEQPKQYLKLAEKTIIEHAITPFLSSPQIKKIVVVLNIADKVWKTLPMAQHEKIMTVEGGEQRCHSVLNGLHALQNISSADDWVLVHDAVRPCLTVDDIHALIKNFSNHKVGGLLGIPVRDTLKQVADNNEIKSTLPRSNIWHALTPQMFRYDKLLHALQVAITHKQFITDESSALEFVGELPAMIAGKSDNIKITYPEDLLLAEKIIIR